MGSNSLRETTCWPILASLLTVLFSCTPASRPSVSNSNETLDSLFAADAFHRELERTARQYNVALRYGGRLGRTQTRGLVPLSEPDKWSITTKHSFDAQGRISQLALQLFNIRIEPTAGPGGDLAFKYANRWYGVNVESIGQRDLLDEYSIAPKIFVSETCFAMHTH